MRTFPLFSRDFSLSPWSGVATLINFKGDPPEVMAKDRLSGIPLPSTSHSRSSRNEVGMGPCFLEAILGLSRLIVLPLGPEALDQPDERPPIVRIVHTVRTIDRFRLGRAIGQQEYSPEMMPH